MPRIGCQAQSAYVSATTAAGNANTAADSIDNMTVSAEDVGPSVPASVIVSDVDGHKNIHFKLKQGNPGLPFIIKGDAYATLADLEADILSPEVGDQYNVGSAPPYNVYRWTGTTWENEGAISTNVDPITNNDINNIYAGTPVSGTRYLDILALTYLIASKIVPDLATKVDKVTGKGLSTNDFTTAYKDAVDTLQTAVSTMQSGKADVSALNSAVSTLNTKINDQGIPSGGAVGQFLRKASATDYDVEWVTIGNASGGNF